MQQPRTRIVSFGHYVPKKVVTNHDLEKYMETSDQWIQQRSGIKERRWVSEGETTLQMATEAAKEALEKANLTADDIDAIVFGALVTDYVFPGTGCLLQKSLGCKKPIPALDLRNQCSGFLYAMSVSDAWIRAGFYKRVLIVASEIQSTALDLSTEGRDVSVLFGDGAAACLVEATNNPEEGVIDTLIASQGEFAEKLFVHRPSPNDHPRLKENLDLTDGFHAHMDGKFVFKNAIIRMCEAVTTVTKKNGFELDDIDFVVAHQANMRINQAVLDHLKIPFEKTHHTIDRYGNTTNATIPLTMNEAVDQGMIKRGDLVALVAFGSGFTWGSTLLRF